MTPTHSPTFNLVDDPWILATDLKGQTREHSIREIFTQAKTLSALANEIASQDAAITRFLIALLWRSVTHTGRLAPIAGLPEDIDPDDWWLALFDQGSLPTEAISTYLDTWHDRFWLIHPERPFYQIPELATAKGEHSGIQRLLVDAESDYFTTRAGAALNSLSLAEAARWIVHVQAFDYSGIKPAALGDPRGKGGKGYPIGTGAAGVGGTVLLKGTNLLETLLLNLPADRVEASAFTVEEENDQDLPAWERAEPPTSAPRSLEASLPDGPLDALTWQSRRVRLYCEEDRVVGVLITNGDKLELGNNLTDPFFARQYSKTLSSKVETVYIPKKHPSERTFWRGVESLLYRHGEMPQASRDKTPIEPPRNLNYLAHLKVDGFDTPNQDISVELVGLEYGTQDSVVTNMVHEEVSVQLKLLTQEGAVWAPMIIQNVRSTLSAATAIGSFAGMVVQASGGTYGFQSDATEQLLAALEPAFRDWLYHLPEQSDLPEATRLWQTRAVEIIRQHAELIARNAPPSASIGRITEKEGSLPQLHSTGTALSWLYTQLRKHLQAAFPATQTKKSATSSPEKERA